MAYYATGTKRKKGSNGDVSFVNVVIPLNQPSRVLAVKQAERIAKRERIKLDGVFVERTARQDRGGVLTKNAANRKKNTNGKFSK